MELTPEQEARWRSAAEKGTLSPAETTVWESYMQQKGAAPAAPQAAPAPTQKLRPTFFPPEDPRAQEPWWRQFFASQAEQAQAPVSPLTGESLYVPGAKPGEQTDIGAVHGATLRQMGAEGLRQVPTALMMATQPEAAPIHAFKGDKLAYLLSEWGVPALRALGLWGMQDVAEQAGNLLYPEDPSNPGAAASLTAGGQFAGEVLMPRIGHIAGKARQVVAETPPPGGTAHREVLERLGGQAPMPLIAERFIPQSADVGVRHSPLGYRSRRVWDKAEEVMQRELERLHDLLPGTRLTETTDVLRALIRGEARPDLLETLPPVLRETFGKRLETVKQELTRAYGQFDAHYLSSPINWHPGRRKYYTPTLDALLQDPSMMQRFGIDPQGRSIFAETSRLLQALDTLPATITLDTALDMQRVVKQTIADVHALLAEPSQPGSPGTLLRDSVDRLVRPALGEALTEFNYAVAPYLVDIRSAKEYARRMVADWERFQVSESALLRGRSGPQANLVDPDIQWAQALIARDAEGRDVINDYVTFLDAHQYRSKALEIARQPGPNLGNTIGRHADQLARSVEAQMRATGNRLDPTFLPHFARVQRQYAEAAEVWNSPYIMEKTGASLDDLLNNLIVNKRPNDLKTLRAVLGKNAAGGDVLDDAAAMWLTQRIQEARRQGPTSLDAPALLDSLEALGGQSERVLFPAGLTQFRQQLRQIVNMEEAAREVAKGAGADARLLAKAKATISDPSLWQAVQESALKGMLQRDGTLLNGTHMLAHLNSLDKVQKVLFDPDLYEALMHLAHTASALQRHQVHNQMWWNPVVRFASHGIVLAGATALTGSPWILGGYTIGVLALDRLMTNPRAVRLLTQGLTTPKNSRAAGAITGAIIGQLTQMGLRDALLPLEDDEASTPIPGTTAPAPGTTPPATPPPRR